MGYHKNGTSETEMDIRYGVRYHLLLLVVQLSVPQKNFDGLFVPDPYISSWVNHYSMFFSCLTQKNIYFLRMGGWPSLKTERRRQKWTSDMESGIIYCFWWCSFLCHKRIWMDYLFQIHIFHPGSPTIQCFLVVSHKKNIYFLRMGSWTSIKTERLRQKWTSDMESGIIYCFWWCSCLCHKRILMDYLFQIHIFHPGSTTIQCFLVVSHKKIYFFSGWAVGLA